MHSAALSRSLHGGLRACHRRSNEALAKRRSTEFLQANLSNMDVARKFFGMRFPFNLVAFPCTLGFYNGNIFFTVKKQDLSLNLHPDLTFWILYFGHTCSPFLKVLTPTDFSV